MNHHRSNLRPARRKKRCIVLLVCHVYILFGGVYVWNQSYIQQELEAPLDHVWNDVFRKPFLRCPHIPLRNDTTSNDSIPIYMLSARPRSQVEPVLQSWASLNVTLVDTSSFSQAYQNTHCHHKSFKTLLFAVYQHVIQQALAETSHASHIMLIEDDAVLLDRHALLSELAYAVEHQLDYYSFYKSNSKLDDCKYDHGTVAQVASRRFLESISHVDTSCRLPIDMWIATQGPWLETTRSVIQHVGKRYHVNSGG